MNDLQKMLKDMVVVSISAKDVVEEQFVDGRIDEIKGLPLFAKLTTHKLMRCVLLLKRMFQLS